METKAIKQKVAHWLERYDAWKRDSMRHISTAGDDQQHHCHCCQAEYVGRFCPHCGQQASTKHIRLPIYFAALVGIIAACYAIDKRKAASREPAGT